MQLLDYNFTSSGSCLSFVDLGLNVRCVNTASLFCIRSFSVFFAYTTLFFYFCSSSYFAES